MGMLSPGKKSLPGAWRYQLWALFRGSPSFSSACTAAAKLSLASINHHQVGQWLFFSQQALVPALHHFLHAGKVVGTFHGFDVEMPVFFLLGRALRNTTMAATG
jgi:hypothetical protein